MQTDWTEVPCYIYRSPGTMYHWQRRLQHTSGLVLDVTKETDQSVRIYLYDAAGTLLARQRLWDGLAYDLARGWHYDGEPFGPLVDAALELLETAPA